MKSLSSFIQSSIIIIHFYTTLLDGDCNKNENCVTIYYIIFSFIPDLITFDDILFTCRQHLSEDTLNSECTTIFIVYKFKFSSRELLDSWKFIPRQR